jgi:putative phage-type endonuclease
MITASDIAQALGCAKFGTQKDFFRKKCGLPEEQEPFDPTVPPLKWGIMFEPVACALYSHMNCGVRVNEFGLLRHPVVPFLGASPDGITDDGVMVEIKCPWRRKIDGTVPAQYYYQIQGQLEVCGLDECDYFECEFAEISAEEAASIDDEWERGVIGETFVDGGYVYEYPSVGLPFADLEAFATRPGWRARWWRLVKTGTVRLLRDTEFVDTMIARLTGEAWERVIAYRADRALYEAECLAASRAAAVKRAATKKLKEDAEPPPVYAFADDDDAM